MTVIEATAGLNLSTDTKVVIACAGLGSRMAILNSTLHKGLLPYKNAPLIWHLISKIPEDLGIIILLGHKSQQIKDFVSITFPNRNIEYIEIVDYTSPNSGTAVSLIQARNKISKSFWYFPCDAYVEDEIFNLLTNSLSSDTIFVSEESSVLYPDDYTVILEDQGQVIDYQYKGNTTQLENRKIFTGFMFIRNGIDFLETLEKKKYTEFVHAFHQNLKVSPLESWRDMGSPDEYKRHLNSESNYDFSKPNEITYVLPSLVVKYFSDKKEALEKPKKPSLFPEVYPKNNGALGHFAYYEKVKGETLYRSVDVSKFRELLVWLKQELWEPVDENIERECREFYEVKTKARINAVSSNLPYDWNQSYSLNRSTLVNPKETLSNLEFDSLLSNIKAVGIHGDLQFDNIIYLENGGFKLIDWRTSFGSNYVNGDIYYDLAKLLGGIEMDYSKIKKGDFTFHITESEVRYEFPPAKNHEMLRSELESFCRAEGYNWEKVCYLTGIIYINMCPLHTRPFRDLLFFHSIDRLSRKNH